MKKSRMAETSTRGLGGQRSARSADTVVLDASAILAVLYGEPGQEEIRRRIRGADVVVGAVNLSEVSAKLCEAGLAREEIREAVDALSPTVHSFAEDLAYAAGELRPLTREKGLSFGDRACLALAQSMRVKALTTDRGWDGLEGAEVVER